MLAVADESHQRPRPVLQLLLDLLAIAGLGVFVLGVDQVFRPAALMIGGLAVVGVAALLARRLAR